MALPSTTYKIELNLTDMDRSVYENLRFTVARHPSETEERVMIRVLAFALHADPALAYGKDLFDVEEPALWLKDLTGAIRLWIDVGLPDERLVVKVVAAAITHKTDVGGVAILWDSGFPVRWTLETSLDGAQWDIAYTSTDSRGDTDLIVFPAGVRHVLSSSADPHLPDAPDAGNTSMLCGELEFITGSHNPIFAALPQWFVIRSQDSSAGTASSPAMRDSA